LRKPPQAHRTLTPSMVLPILPHRHVEAGGTGLRGVALETNGAMLGIALSNPPEGDLVGSAATEGHKQHHQSRVTEMEPNNMAHPQ